MKVVYVKTILEKIQDAKREAHEVRKQIDYIELSDEEERELCGMFSVPVDKYTAHGSIVFGVRLSVK